MTLASRLLLVAAAFAAAVGAVAVARRGGDSDASARAAGDADPSGPSVESAPPATLAARAPTAATLDALLAGVEQDDAAARVRLREIVARQPDLLDTLLSMLREPLGSMRPPQSLLRVERALGAIGAPAVDRLRALYATADPGLRNAIIECFGYAGPAAASAAGEVAAFLRESRGGDREFAVVVLRQIGRGAEVAVPDLAAVLADASASLGLRREAVRAIVAVGGSSPAALDALRPVLADPRSDVLEEALVALATLGRDAAPVRAAVLSLLDDDQPSVRGLAASLVGNIGVSDAAAIRGLSRVLVEEGDPARTSAGLAMASLGADGIAALLRIAKAEPDVAPRLAAFRALDGGGASARDHVSLMLAILDERVDSGWKARTLDVVASLRPPARAADAMPAIRRAALDATEPLTIAALRAAASLEGDADGVVGLLLEALSRDENAVKSAAASLLGRFPAQAARVVPPLLDAFLRSPPARSAAIGSLRVLALAAPAVRADIAAARTRAAPDAAAELDDLLATLDKAAAAAAR